jgi:hypothetical protein
MPNRTSRPSGAKLLPLNSAVGSAVFGRTGRGIRRPYSAAEAPEGRPCTGLGQEDHSSYPASTSPMHTDTLCPPNPRLFDSAFRIRIARASPGT